jgi:hypothetical protein
MKQNHMHIIAPLLLFILSSICAVLMVLAGIRLYSRMNETASSLQDNRTAISYIRNKVRSLSPEGTVAIETIEDKDALLLTDSINNTSYTTYIYIYDNALYEYYASSATPFLPSAGSEILSLKDMTITEENGLLSLTCTSKNNTSLRALIALKEASHA